MYHQFISPDYLTPFFFICTHLNIYTHYFTHDVHHIRSLSFVGFGVARRRLRSESLKNRDVWSHDLVPSSSSSFFNLLYSPLQIAALPEQQTKTVTVICTSSETGEANDEGKPCDRFLGGSEEDFSSCLGGRQLGGSRPLYGQNTELAS